MTIQAQYAAATLALVLAGAAYVAGQAWLERPAPSRPSRGAVARPTAPTPPPTARDLLGRADALGLTAEQTARLTGLDRAWAQESVELERAVDAARAAFDRFARAAAAGAASLDEIQRQSAEYRKLGAALREQRQRHGDAARAIFSGTQRARLGPPTNPDGGIR
jgi:hypothetical protein